MKMRIISVGKISKSETHYLLAQDEYLKRLKPYAEISIVELNDFPSKESASDKERQQVKEKEGEEILSKIKDGDYVCLLDLNKKEMTSEEFSSSMMDMLRFGGSSLTFVIGGSLGLGENIRKRGNASISLSKMTFTHKMTRIILLEQIYRGFKIDKNEPYHK